MSSRFVIALFFMVLASLLLVGGTSIKENDAGSQARFSYLPKTNQIEQLNYSVVFTTVLPISTPPSTTPVPPTATPLPSPVPPSPTPAVGESGSRSGSPVFLIFLVIIFGGIVLAVIISTLKIGRRR
jgi:hypothetical protein